MRVDLVKKQSNNGKKRGSGEREGSLWVATTERESASFIVEDDL